MSEPIARRHSVPVLLLLSLFVILGLCGIAGGIAFFLDPSGSLLGIEESWMRLPMGDYLLPGLFLLLVFGLGSLVEAGALWRGPHWTAKHVHHRGVHYHWSWIAAWALGSSLTLWMVSELLVIGYRSGVQISFALLAILIMALALLPEVRREFEEPPERSA